MVNIGPNILAFTVSALLALVISCFIYTEFKFTYTLAIPTSAENLLKFMSNPMVTKELHRDMVAVHLLSSSEAEEGESKYIRYSVTEKLVFWHYSCIVDMHIHPEKLVIHNYASPLAGLVKVNATYIMRPSDENPDSCYVTEESTISQPWIFHSFVKSTVEVVHKDLLHKTKDTIIRLTAGGFGTTQNPLGSSGT